MNFKCEECINAIKISEGKQKGIAADVSFKIKILECSKKGKINLNYPGKMTSCKEFSRKYDWILDTNKWEWQKKEVD